ncbi:hypothetical protein ACFE04_011690 [Oxalis oulophora]
MAAYHSRSISLPSRVHPVTSNVEEQLFGLKASLENSSSVFQRLSFVKELNECVESFLKLPSTQQTLSTEIYRESMLDGSLRMLDLCGITRDAFSQTKDSLQELESCLRRKRGCESGFRNEISKYMESRKKSSKVINNFSKNSQKKCTSSKDSETTAVVRTLEEVNEIIISVFGSLLSFVSVPKSKSNWSIVAKLMKSKRDLCEDDTNEIVKMEAQLFDLMSGKDAGVGQVQQVLNGLKAIESNIEEIAEELECVFRQLLKNRASLLNILNH